MFLLEFFRLGGFMGDALIKGQVWELLQKYLKMNLKWKDCLLSKERKREKMKEENYKNYLIRLAVIQKEVSRLRIECLKRNYQNVDNFMMNIIALQDEEKTIINQFDLGELICYYEDYKDVLTKEDLAVLSKVLLLLHIKKNKVASKGRG